MGHPEFENKGSAIGRFIEECGESLAAAGKCIRFGFDSWNPLLPEVDRETNDAWLQREVADLETAIARLKKSRRWEPVSQAPEEAAQSHGTFAEGLEAAARWIEERSLRGGFFTETVGTSWSEAIRAIQPAAKEGE